MDNNLNKNENNDSNNLNQEKLTSLELEKNSNINEPPEIPYYDINKNSPKNYNDNSEAIRCILALSIINLIIVLVLIFVDIIISISFDFINQIYVYINRIFMIIISLFFLLTYKKVSKCIRKAKLIILIINLIVGIILRIIQANVDPKFSDDVVTKIAFYFIFSLCQIIFVIILNMVIKNN